MSKYKFNVDTIVDPFKKNTRYWDAKTIFKSLRSVLTDFERTEKAYKLLSVVEDFLTFLSSVPRFGGVCRLLFWLLKGVKVCGALCSLPNLLRFDRASMEGLLCQEWLGFAEIESPSRDSEYRDISFARENAVELSLWKEILASRVKIHKIVSFSKSAEKQIVDLDKWIKGEYKHQDLALCMEYKNCKSILFDRAGLDLAFVWNGSYGHPTLFATLCGEINSAIISNLSKRLISVEQPTTPYSAAKFSVTDMFSEDIHGQRLYDRILFEKLSSVIENSLAQKIKTGILLYGRPGVSKTSTVLEAIQNINAVKIRIGIGAYGFIPGLLAMVNTKKILILDDIDVSEIKGRHASTISLMHLLDSTCYDVAIVIVNSLRLDSALVRAGRIDVKILCPLPSQEMCEEIVQNIQKYHEDDFGIVNVKDSAKELIGFTHAQIHTIFKNAKRMGFSISESLAHYKKMEAEAEKYLEDSPEIELAAPMIVSDYTPKQIVSGAAW